MLLNALRVYRHDSSVQRTESYVNEFSGWLPERFSQLRRPCWFSLFASPFDIGLTDRQLRNGRGPLCKAKAPMFNGLEKKVLVPENKRIKWARKWSQLCPKLSGMSLSTVGGVKNGNKKRILDSAPIEWLCWSTEWWSLIWKYALFDLCNVHLNIFTGLGGWQRRWRRRGWRRWGRGRRWEWRDIVFCPEFFPAYFRRAAYWKIPTTQDNRKRQFRQSEISETYSNWKGGTYLCYSAVVSW